METRLGDSDRPDSPAPAVALREARLMRSVNANMRRLAEALAHPDPIAFFCECQSPTCHSVIWMSMAAFDAMVADRTGWLLLLEGHEPSGVLALENPLPGPEDNEVAERNSDNRSPSTAAQALELVLPSARDFATDLPKSQREKICSRRGDRIMLTAW